MKAAEYFKKHGYKHCKSAYVQNGWLNTGFWVQLKRLVESHELVSDYYGLARAKEHAESNYTAPELKAALKQAIADVEACKESFHE